MLSLHWNYLKLVQKYVKDIDQHHRGYNGEDVVGEDRCGVRPRPRTPDCGRPWLDTWCGSVATSVSAVMSVSCDAASTATSTHHRYEQAVIS